MSKQSVVKVGIADLNIVTAPDVIRTSGLGSCVGVVIFNKNKQIAGMAHVMLPDSNLGKQATINRYKYADTAIDILVEELMSRGIRKPQLQAKIAGGAQMFQINTGNDMMRIGKRNVEAVLTKLAEHKIPVISSDVGGNFGRTIEFDPQTGLLKIRTITKGEHVI
ncbi:chemotaxis protein CheD [Ornithinibacillus sp. BX22]|uniref:Probable chemoreceptor glutamine deamidase CheD n=2 Tax=Ornithinibacillus TaxID=484508 RepID=A0A923L3U5_9BACI|nr:MULTISPECIES: chemotaxis protein CheD [Ornithinibacillus]MBC5635985.1 chemotaxis protein CheD [Ornithinibacillus hominis]MBS3680026.1 chemotaxis protein CheD [Ornithinibacillus massiliensis]